MDYVIASTVSTDKVCLPDGKTIDLQPGSAGFYALAGIRIFTDQVIICGGIGPDYISLHGKWYTDNGLSTTGLVLRSESSPVISVCYFQDGSRIDTPNIGLREFRALDPAPEEVFRFCSADTKGVYVFKDLDRDYLDALIGGKKRYHYKLMWEIAEDACRTENIDIVESYLKDIDIFSINAHEAGLLYQSEDEAYCEKRLASASRGWVFFRRGKKGAHMIADGSVYTCPSARSVMVVDTTGGGNSSSAAVLYAACEKYPPQMAGCIGSAAAALIIKQFGVPAIYTEEMREYALKQAEVLSQTSKRLLLEPGV